MDSVTGFEKARVLPTLGQQVSTTEDIREIVQCLNSPPFNKGTTLVAFDELSPLELLELLNEVCKYLDPKHDVEIRSEPQDQTANRFTEMMKVLNYPSNYDIIFQQGLVSGDRRTIYPILHYILSWLPQMEQRAYLARYLVNLAIPEDILMDEDVGSIHNQHKELQAEFQVVHQQLEETRAQSLPPSDLKQDIEQLESEREQLLNKIQNFKNKSSNKKEFTDLLDSTSKLRKEQEEEARLVEKMDEQQAQLEWCEGTLLTTEQRLVDIRKAVSEETSAGDMLNLLKNDVKRNRDFCNERIGMELNEKSKRLEQMNKLLSEPVVTQTDIDSTQNEIRTLQRECQLLEEKANANTNPAQDKLAIYKQQAALVSKKKEKAHNAQQDAEREASRNEQQMSEVEREYEQVRGGSKFVNRSEFHNYVTMLKSKGKQFRVMKSQLKEIRSELAILDRTEKILKSRTANLTEALSDIEKQRGIAGYQQTREELQTVSEVKAEYDIAKNATLEEYSKVVKEITERIKAVEERVRPQMNQVKGLRSQCADLTTEYEQKKANFDRANASIESEKGKLEAEVKELTDATNAQESKIHSLIGQAMCLEQFVNRSATEKSYVAGEKRFNEDFKTIQESFIWRKNQQNQIVAQLRQTQQVIKESHEVKTRQMQMFGNLRQLLELKYSTVTSDLEGSGAIYRGQDFGGDVGKGGMNRLVL